MHLAMAGRKEGREEGREINRVVKRIRFPSPSTSSAFVRPRPVTSTREGNGGILCHSMTRGDCVGEMYLHGVERPIYNINSASDAKKGRGEE